MESIYLQVMPVGYEGRAVRVIGLKLGSDKQAQNLQRSLEEILFVRSATVYARQEGLNGYAIELDAWVMKPVMWMVAKRISRLLEVPQVQLLMHSHKGLGERNKVWTFRF